MCEPCGKLADDRRYCPTCNRIREDGEKAESMLKCNVCDLWVHVACAGLTDQQYKTLCAVGDKRGGEKAFFCDDCQKKRFRETAESVVQDLFDKDTLNTIRECDPKSNAAIEVPLFLLLKRKCTGIILRCVASCRFPSTSTRSRRESPPHSTTPNQAKLLRRGKPLPSSLRPPKPLPWKQRSLRRAAQGQRNGADPRLLLAKGPPMQGAKATPRGGAGQWEREGLAPEPGVPARTTP